MNQQPPAFAVKPRTSAQIHYFKPQDPVPSGMLDRVKAELRAQGAVAFDLLLPEARYLPHLLQQNEQIRGSVFGKYEHGRGVLVATDQRVLFLDKKPFYMHVDELNYLLIGGVTYTQTIWVGHVTLHTSLGDYHLRTFNLKNAINFVEYIDRRCLKEDGYVTTNDIS